MIFGLLFAANYSWSTKTVFSVRVLGSDDRYDVDAETMLSLNSTLRIYGFHDRILYVTKPPKLV